MVTRTGIQGDFMPTLLVRFWLRKTFLHALDHGDTPEPALEVASADILIVARLEVLE